MSVTKAKVANALTSAAKDHIIAVASDIFDEELQMYQDEINKAVANGSAGSDCVLDLGVTTADAAFEKAGEPEVVNDPKIRMIHWRTSDSTADGGRGAGGTIFQVRYSNWYVVQWMMFFGSQRICRARSITTGGRHTVGEWQELLLPTSYSYDVASRQIKAAGLQPSVNMEAAKENVLVTLPEATTARAGLMSASDKSKLSSLPTSANLQTSLSGKVDKSPGKGLSTFDFNDEHLQRLCNAGLYGRKYGLKYAVRNLYTLTSASTDDEIRAALTSSDGVRLLETDLTYCAENGCCLFDETTNGYILVNKATPDGTMYNLIEISISKIGAPGVTSFELPSMRVITLLSKADENLPSDQWTAENAIWSCKRVLQEKFAYRSELAATAKQLFIDTWNRYAKLNNARYDPANAPDADHPFYANEIWLTYEEAVAAHEYGRSDFNLPYRLGINTTKHTGVRTNLLMPMGPDAARMATLEKVAYNHNTLETLRVSAFTDSNVSSNYMGVTPVNTLYDFCRGCSRLKKVIGNIYLDRLTTSSTYNYSRVFVGCSQLEDFSLIRLKTNLGLSGVPKASLKSIRILVDCAINTEPVTVAVHPDVYAKLTGDTTNPAAAALGTKEADQWATLLQAAADQQIQFTDTAL